MSADRVLKRLAHTVRVGVAILVSLQVSLVGTLANAAPQDQEPATKSPVKHVISIVGENRTFDHIFAEEGRERG
jgi:phospholipase C